jgi:hypothetical protein
MRQYDDLLIDALLDRGFTVEEAQQLIDLQDRLQREQHTRQQSGQSGTWRTPDSGWQPSDDRPRS